MTILSTTVTPNERTAITSFPETLSSSSGAAHVGFVQSGGAIDRTVQDKLRDEVSVKDFGAIGTADPSNVDHDTTAFLAAMATGKNVFVPEGTYYTSQTILVGYGQILRGNGQYKTIINYTGSGSGIFLGSKTRALIYNCELHDFTLFCTNRADTVNGIELQHCIYFNLSNLSIFGSGSPNSEDPADRVLYGSGLYLSNNSIIGRVSHVSCRLWEYGYYLKTLSGSQSYWTAAIVFDGHGELANCMRGIVVGDPTIGYFSGANCSFRDLSIQGCYTAGININSGNNTIIDSCYFEGNANYDVTVGSPYGSPPPLCVKIINNNMSAGDILGSPYGDAPYIAKIYVDEGIFTSIRDNHMSISTSIPLIILGPNAVSTSISGNRLNSTTAYSMATRITNNGAATETYNNYPEAPTVAIGSVTRTLSTASNSVSYTGLGFQPTSIEFVGSVDTVAAKTIGFAGLTGTGIRNRCMTTAENNTNTSSAHCIKYIRPTAADYVTAVVTSFDKDGFTLNWTTTGSPPPNDLIVNYIARR